MTTEAAAEAVKAPATPIADILSWIELLNGWAFIGIGFIVLALALFFYSLQRGTSRFNFGDAFIDNTTGQTSYLRIIIFGCFVCAWVVVFVMVLRAVDVQTFVLGILGIFVTNIIANRGFEVFDPRVKAQAINSAPSMATQPPDPTPQQGAVTINTEIKQ